MKHLRVSICFYDIALAKYSIWGKTATCIDHAAWFLSGVFFLHTSSLFDWFLIDSNQLKSQDFAKFAWGVTDTLRSKSSDRRKPQENVGFWQDLEAEGSEIDISVALHWKFVNRHLNHHNCILSVTLGSKLGHGAFATTPAGPQRSG